jgi:hypothetical protein
MYDAYFEQRALIPEGRVYDVSYEDLERQPVSVIWSIHESLGLSGFEDVRPRLEGYLASFAGYRKNRHGDLPEELRQRIAHEWGQSFNEWRYERCRSACGLIPIYSLRILRVAKLGGASCRGPLIAE